MTKNILILILQYYYHTKYTVNDRSVSKYLNWVASLDMQKILIYLKVICTLLPKGANRRNTCKLIMPTISISTAQPAHEGP